MKQLKIIGFILSALVLLCACQPDTVCRQDWEIYCYAAFIDSTGVGGQDTLVVWDLEETLSDAENPLYFGSTASEVTLPLRFDTTVSVFVMNYRHDLDTLYVCYQNDMRFVSMACGCFIFQTIDTAYTTGAHRTKIEIENSHVENYKQRNLRVEVH